MGYAFDSEEARDLNADIFETIYYGALESSMTLSKQREQDMIVYKRGMEQHDDTKHGRVCGFTQDESVAENATPNHRRIQR